MGLRNLQQWSNIAKEAFQGTLFFTKCLCFLHVTNTYIFTTAWTYGPSMLPTLNLTGDLVLAERISIRSGNVSKGDIVILRSPENPRRTVTKRVKGLEGDRVTYVLDPKNSDKCETVVVPKGHVWIEGDNIYNSKDSRNFGAIPYGLLQGKLFWRKYECIGEQPPSNRLKPFEQGTQISGVAVIASRDFMA